MESKSKHLDINIIHWNKQIIQRIKIVLNNGTILVVQRLNEGHVDEVYLLEQELFFDPWPKSAFEQECETDESILNVVGLIDDKIVAYAFVQFVLDEAHIHNFGVSKQYQRQGIGDTLLEFLFSVTGSLGIKVIHLEVRKSNVAAIALYKKKGFEIVGLRKNYYEQGNEDALLMSRFQ